MHFFRSPYSEGTNRDAISTFYSRTNRQLRMLHVRRRRCHALLVFAHIVSEDEVADFRETLSVLLVSSARQLCPRRILHGGVVQPSLAALLFCLTGKSCSALFTLLLKMELSLALVRFWCFLVYFIHSGTFLFRINYKKEIVLAKRSITESV